MLSESRVDRGERSVKGQPRRSAAYAMANAWRDDHAVRCDKPSFLATTRSLSVEGKARGSHGVEHPTSGPS